MALESRDTIVHKSYGDIVPFNVVIGRIINLDLKEKRTILETCAVYWLCIQYNSEEDEMADRSTIEWTDATWNPATGCTKISAGCDHCYAERFSERFRGVKNHPFEFGFDLKLKPARLDQPLKWKKSRMIFVNSMSDLFHKNIPDSYIDDVFDTMEEADHHVYQILTKRSSLMRNYMKKRYASKRPPTHIWVGVSIETKKELVRLRHLQQTLAAVRFISYEPLLASVGPVNMDGIDWAIVGGESGPGSRAIDPEWVRELRDQCLEQNVAFFFKQWGGRTPKARGNKIDGRQWLQFPSNAQPLGAVA